MTSDKHSAASFSAAAGSATSAAITDSRLVNEIFQKDQDAEDTARLNHARWYVLPLLRFGV